jgi:hypothetical protein
MAAAQQADRIALRVAPSVGTVVAELVVEQPALRIRVLPRKAQFCVKTPSPCGSTSGAVAPNGSASQRQRRRLSRSTTMRGAFRWSVWMKYTSGSPLGSAGSGVNSAIGVSRSHTYSRNAAPFWSYTNSVVLAGPVLLTLRTRCPLAL